MKRKERRLLFRVINAVASLVVVCSAVYLYIVGISALAVSGIVVSLCCVAGPVAVAGGSATEVVLGIAEALVHALVDAVLGIFEAIGNAFSSIG